MFTLPQQQFLSLLRAGLWGTPADPGLFTEDVDWKGILRLAKEQTVTVIIADGIETLPQQFYPPKEIMLQLMMIMVKTKQMHNLLNTTLNLVTSTLNAQGIPSVLLKGQGIAQNYRIPESRMCGDIDLYVGEENYKRACAIVAGLSPEENALGLETDIHQHITINGVEIEIHRIADFMGRKRDKEELQAWEKKCMNMRNIPSTDNIWHNAGTDICLPPHTYNSFFILHHIIRHLATEGIGLRQVCDWTLYLHKYHQQIDGKELEDKLKIFKMRELWDVFSVLATKILGLSNDNLPLQIRSNSSSKTSILLNHIFETGNFGHYASERIDATEKIILKRKWRNFRIQSSRLFKLFQLSPKYAVSYWWGWFWSAIKRLNK